VLIEKLEELPEEIKIFVEELPSFFVYSYNKKENTIELLFAETGYILKIE